MEQTGLLFPKTPTKKKKKHHKPSILQDKNRTCYLCILLNGDHHKHRTLHEHHIFGGPNRIHSEEEGLKVYLCPEHHLTGLAAVHRCQETQNILHLIGQQEFEKTHTREEFMNIFGRNYLWILKYGQEARKKKADTLVCRWKEISHRGEKDGSWSHARSVEQSAGKHRSSRVSNGQIRR